MVWCSILGPRVVFPINISPSKTDRNHQILFVGFSGTGNSARTAWMVGMELLACHECVEVVFIAHLMIYDLLVLDFWLGKLVWTLEIASNDYPTGRGVQTSVSEKGRI